MAPNLNASLRTMSPVVTGYLDRYSIRSVAGVLSAGGVAVLPTDTIYGLHCAASNLEAVEEIRRLKGRGTQGGFILLAADVPMADAIVARWPGAAKERLAEIWPAPLTAILPARVGCPPVLSSKGTIAVRVPAYEDLRALIKIVGEPIVSTSANLSGRRPMTRIADIRKAFPGLDAYVSRRGRPPKAPSTIVDFTPCAPRLVRAGSYPWAAA